MNLLPAYHALYYAHGTLVPGITKKLRVIQTFSFVYCSTLAGSEGDLDTYVNFK